MRRAVVVGRAAGVMEEYRAACEMCDFDDVIVVGKIGEVFPDRIDYWASFHINLFDKWAATRATNGHLPASCFCGAYFKGHKLGVARDKRTGREIVATKQVPLQHVQSVGGSSGFMAAKNLALDVLRCDRVVLVGVPMTAEGHHATECITPQEVAQGAWGEADKYWKTWVEYMSELQGRVRSMSGRTMEALGMPTKEWLGC